MACGCISQKAAKIGLGVTLPVLAISIVVIVLFPGLFNDILKKEITLQKGTLATDVWKDVPIPIYERLHFFNITNKEAFLAGEEPLNVTEVGPYTYTARWVKNYLAWNSNDTVSYRETRTYHFVPDMSNGTEDDEIYTLNGPMILASSIAKGYDVKLRILLSVLLGILGEDIIIKRSVRELVYEGYEDIIVKFAPIIIPDIPFKEGRFAWLYGKNATDDGLFTVFTGADDQSKTDFINNWNGEEKVNFWKGDTCNMINGTSFELGPPIHGNPSGYAFFQSLFCRSLTLNYTEDVTHFNVLSKRFKPTYDLFANSTENPENYCFEGGKERASGVQDLSPCQFGAPVFLSYPHFYMGDPSYLRNVNGLNPNEEEHGSHVDVEIITGFTCHASVKFQLNIEIDEVEGILQTYNVTKGMFPVLWVELSIEIDQKFANKLLWFTRIPKIISYSVLGILIGACSILAITFLVILCLRKSDDEHDDDDPLLDAVDKEYGSIQNSINCTKEKVNTDEDGDSLGGSSDYSKRKYLEAPSKVSDY